MLLLVIGFSCCSRYLSGYQLWTQWPKNCERMDSWNCITKEKMHESITLLLRYCTHTVDIGYDRDSIYCTLSYFILWQNKKGLKGQMGTLVWLWHSYSIPRPQFIFLYLSPGVTSHHLLAIHMTILRDERQSRKERWRKKVIQMMILEQRYDWRGAAVTIMHLRHLSAQRSFVKVRTHIHARALARRQRAIWELMRRPDLLCPRSFPFSHFSSSRSQQSHCDSTGEQFVLIRAAPNECREQTGGMYKFRWSCFRGEEKKSFDRE